MGGTKERGCSENNGIWRLETASLAEDAETPGVVLMKCKVSRSIYPINDHSLHVAASSIVVFGIEIEHILFRSISLERVRHRPRPSVHPRVRGISLVAPASLASRKRERYQNDYLCRWREGPIYEDRLTKRRSCFSQSAPVTLAVLRLQFVPLLLPVLSRSR